MFAPASSTIPVDATLTFSASVVDVYWARQDFASTAGSPTSPDQPLTSLAKGPPQDGEERLEDVQGEAVSWNPEANWLLVVSSETARVAWNVSGLDVFPAANASWRAGHAAEVRQQVLPGTSLVHEEHPADGLPIVRASPTGAGVVEGDAWLYLWSLNATLAEGRGRTASFPSGFWTDNRTGTEVDSHGVAREDHAQFLALHLQNARLRVEQRRGDVLVAADAVHVTGDVQAILEGAHGVLDGLGPPTRLDGEALELAGDLNLTVRSASSPTAVRIEARGHVDHAALDGAPLAGGGTVARSPLPSIVAIAFLVLAALGAASWGAAALRRRRVDPIERAEDFVLKGRPERARRELRSFLERRPNDVQAWFLLGASWLQENAPERLIEELEPVARRLQGPDLATLAFLLAMAHARLRSSEAVLEWLPQAVRDPALRERAAGEPGFAFLREDARFQRLVESGGSAYG